MTTGSVGEDIVLSLLALVSAAVVTVALVVAGAPRTVAAVVGAAVHVSGHIVRIVSRWRRWSRPPSAADAAPPTGH